MNKGINRLAPDVWQRNDVLYYTDTDSMYIPIKYHKNLGDMIGKNLGQFKNDYGAYEIVHGIFLMPKVKY